jgi:hypothetical protein
VYKQGTYCTVTAVMDTCHTNLTVPWITGRNDTSCTADDDKAAIAATGLDCKSVVSQR